MKTVSYIIFGGVAFILLPLIFQLLQVSKAEKDIQIEMSNKKLKFVEYEVYGIVQGVFFRKHTQKKGKELGIRGWVMNTSKGTVIGQMEGEKDKVDAMKIWLQKVGSPQSRIDKCDFRNEREIESYSFLDFTVKH